VNPCGEEPLPPFGVCNLGALNLAAFVQDGALDAAALAEHARVAIRFLDDVIDANHYFLDENRQAQLGTRRTGLGTMGLADALLLLGMRYGSDASLELIERIYRTIRDAAYDASCELAAVKGAFPRFDQDKYLQGEFIARLPRELQEKIAHRGIGNAVLLCQAPTGTTSLLAGVSSGIEPIFDVATLRRDRLGEHVIYHPLYQRWQSEHPNESLPDYFVTAADLSPEEHVVVQATIQRYTDASISKTVNAPNRHTVQEVDFLCRLADELGCKGITYYRDGSRDAALSHLDGKANGSPLAARAPEAKAQLRPRPHVLRGATHRVATPVGTAFITLNENGDTRLREVFVTVGRADSDLAADAEAIGRLISLVLRVPTDVPHHDLGAAIVDQLAGIGGSACLGFGARRVRSLADVIARVLTSHAEARVEGDSETAVRDRGDDPAVDGLTNLAIPRHRADLCPRCDEAALAWEEGCRTCHACGFSAC
jgi:ribonucleoside-diphosphate reductase alpha chain